MMIKKCVYLDCIIKIKSMNIDYILLIMYFWLKKKTLMVLIMFNKHGVCVDMYR